MRYLIKNWRNFQHYHDRNPPWIKLHFSMLASEDWVCLDDASRVLAVACMLVGSRKGGEIDGSPTGLAYLQRVAYLHKKPNLTPLIECGFLESASEPEQKLAKATTETETQNPTEESIASSASALSAAEPINGAEAIPLNNGSQWHCSAEFKAELDRLYPAVDVPQTLREIRGWCIGNPSKRKTPRGVQAFITRWFQKEQDRHGS